MIFIKSNPVILGSISLDLFAVLFGSATALLSVYASTILMVGFVGLGILRAAPAIGASNQLGEFESDLAASIFGTVPAALVGGIGTICVVLLWMKIFQKLRKMDKYG